VALKKVIVWSGGADSTLLLASALTSAKADGLLTEKAVAAITLDHHQMNLEREPMRKAEATARQNFKRWAARNGMKFDSFTVTVSADTDVSPFAAQFSLWASHVILYAGSIFNIHEDVEIQFGYVKRDIFWHSKSEFLQAFDALSRLSWLTKMRATFPLEWHEKQDVIGQLRDLSVPQKCWWTCENPGSKGRPCGECAKCIEVSGVTRLNAGSTIIYEGRKA
jgi:7-cyano-7-deazaguanine synthase in queuosine biosynthesis